MSRKGWLVDLMVSSLDRNGEDDFSHKKFLGDKHYGFWVTNTTVCLSSTFHHYHYPTFFGVAACLAERFAFVDSLHCSLSGCLPGCISVCPSEVPLIPYCFSSPCQESGCGAWTFLLSFVTIKK